MTQKTVTLVLTAKGGSLMFRDSTHRFRKVLPGEAFTTDAATADRLVKRNPHVARPEDVPRGNPDLSVVDGGAAPAEDIDELNVTELRALAERLGLGLPKKTRRPELLEAIRTAQAAGSTDEGSDEDPDAAAGDDDGSGGPDGTDAGSGNPTGTVAIGDLPDSALKGPEQG